MKPRLLVTGAGGFVGGWVVREAAAAWEVHAISRGGAPEALPTGVAWHSTDPLPLGALEEIALAVKPTAIIHTAAMADIDACEARPEEAMGVNVMLTDRVTTLAESLGARLIHVSTDTVFDGMKGNYNEEDPTRPINHYARTKVQGEQAVRRSYASWVIARTSLVMGLPAFGAGNSFLMRWRKAWSEGKVVEAPSAEIRTPIDVVTLARALVELASYEEFTGTIHLAGLERLNRIELARRAAKRLGYDPALAQPNDPTDLPGRAPRPLDASLDCSLAKRTLHTPMLKLNAAFDLVLG